jgi:hypothetical protein
VIPLKDYIYTEGRYRILLHSDPATASLLLGHAEEAVRERWQAYRHLASADEEVKR